MVVVCMLAAYYFTSSSDCFIPFKYSLYSTVVSAMVLILLEPVGMVILPGYVVRGPVLASYTLTSLSKTLFPDQSLEYAFRGA